MIEIYRDAIEAAKRHARERYPEESCGYVVDGVYVPAKNVLNDPETHDSTDAHCQCRLCAFQMGEDDVERCMLEGELILHSHPNGPVYPSKADMAGQERTGLPWGIIALDDERIGDPEIWGDTWPKAPILGRTFMHGIRDCYTLVRDTFAAGKDQLAKDGITTEWPFDPIYLRDDARDDNWWEGEDNFYDDFASHGFHEIHLEEARAGDCFLVKIRSEKFNHAGVLVASDLILHHLPGRMSRREPAGLWARAAGRWLRYGGKVAK